MIYGTFEQRTDAFTWNTGERMELIKETLLSDYTELVDDFDTNTLEDILNYVIERNKHRNLNKENLSLMMVTTGSHKGCQVWIDKSLLNIYLEIHDPKKGFQYYCN